MQDIKTIHESWKELKPHIGQFTSMLDNVAMGAKDIDEAFKKGYEKGYKDGKEADIKEQLKESYQKGYNECHRDMIGWVDSAIRTLNCLKGE
ncbi:MAG: hypothetical protein MJZ34_13635 [Paludibacteraceae bacterium]|nr:hypothetical protein [Paludibacteraceae bacterium]